MVDFLKKRLQVFVSSTYNDLKEERQAAVEAILVSGHIPAGMELFSAGDESQMEVIRQWIDESDVYLLILGGRYGSVEPKSGKSYTQLEYEYALERDKPIFACVIKPEYLEKKVRAVGSSVLEANEPKKLGIFRELVLSRTVRFWDDVKDIKIAIGEAMANFARREDLTGWVRPLPDVDMASVAAEISRLSSENAKLKNAVDSFGHTTVIAGLPYQDIKELLHRKKLLSVFFKQRNKFGSDDPFFLIYRDFTNQLVRLGLIEETRDDVYDTTPDGRAFLSKLELDWLRENSNSVSGQE